MSQQAINDIPQILSKLGIHNVVISPGSRSAPLVMAFNRHKDMKTFVVPDERSAAFIAMGMALKTRKTTVLVCTSGSAAYNYAPAVAEAYFQQVPLLILTADRPPEWIDQWDGQTIRQQDIYGKHVLKSYQYPTDLSHPDCHWHARRMINEAALLTTQEPNGPVHVNIPLREPLYPATNEPFNYDENIRVFHYSQPKLQFQKENIPKIEADCRRIMLVVGQHEKSEELSNIVKSLSSKIVVITDAQSNQSHMEGCIQHHDLFLSARLDQEELVPDLMITIGKSVISKNFKTFIKKHKPKAHWHMAPYFPVVDTYQSLTQVIQSDGVSFLKAFEEKISAMLMDKEFANKWRELNIKTKELLNVGFQNQPFSEFEAIQTILDALPHPIDLHVSNSMPVRYVNFLGIKHAAQEMYVNRGTSGIDGSVSTAVGCALMSSQKTVLITGDLAFFYDRNGLWHNHLPDNLLIFVLNNHGGGIFGMISGPKQQPELERFFITEQKLSAANTAKDFNMDYFLATDRISLHHCLPQALASSKASIVEIETHTRTNESVFNHIKSLIAL